VQRKNRKRKGCLGIYSDGGAAGAFKIGGKIMQKVIVVVFVAVMVMMAFVGVVSAVTGTFATYVKTEYRYEEYKMPEELIETHTMCKDTEDSVPNRTGHFIFPVNETTEFYVTDSRAVCFVQIERINRGDTFRFEWYDPRDLLYQVDNSTTDTNFRCWYAIYSDRFATYSERVTSYLDAQGNITLRAGTVDISPPRLGWETCWLSSSLKIDGGPPANRIGNWHVDFYYNGEKQFTETFTILALTPSPTATVTKIPTTEEKEVPGFKVVSAIAELLAVAYLLRRK
jgi:hypothetical protein